MDTTNHNHRHSIPHCEFSDGAYYLKNCLFSSSKSSLLKRVVLCSPRIFKSRQALSGVSPCSDVMEGYLTPTINAIAIDLSKLISENIPIHPLRGNFLCEVIPVDD